MSSLILDLFPGLELLGRAFREAGFCVVSGPDKLWGDDIRDFRPPPGRFDGIIGGSPCQAFSALSNLVRAKGLEPRFGNLVPEFERVVVEAGPLWFLHENVPAAPIPSPRGYSVQDFTLCNSSIPGEDGLGQEQERVRRFTFGWRLTDTGELVGTAGVLVAPNLLRWIPRAALRLPACQRTGAATSPQHHRGKRDRENGWGKPRPGRVRTAAVVADARETPIAIGGSGKPKRTLQAVPVIDFATATAHALNGTTSEMPDDFVTVSPTGKAFRFRKPAVAYDDGPPGTRDRLRSRAVSSDTGGQRDPIERRPGSTPRRSLAEMLRLQGLPENLLADLPLTAKAARKLVANGVPMFMGRAVAQAVKAALAALTGIDSGDASGLP